MDPDDVPSTAPHPCIDVMLETLGYNKFRNVLAKPSGAPREPADCNLPGLGITYGDGLRAANTDTNYFSRRVSMAYTKSFVASIKDRWANSRAAGGPGHSQSREQSTASVTMDCPTQEPKLKARGYTFQSPWDGRCEFRTGNGGRSVKCMHTLHDQPATYNPLVDGEGNNTAAAKSSSTISELRFNLPGTDIFPDAADRSARAKWRGHFAKLAASHHDDDDDTVSPFDVNIGAEEAGGGNRGKRAKLGKLIVYHEGLKMLDLVVAANIGVWWEAWERHF